MQIVPTQPIPSQVLQVQLGGQDCTIRLYQKTTGCYLDLLVGGVLVLAGALCLVGVRVVRSAYLGFVGDLAFIDMTPAAGPYAPGKEPDEVDAAGLGGRFFLAYLP